MSAPLAGLYGITSAEICRDEDRLLRAVTAALRGGTRWLQYRDKQATPAERLRRAGALAALCRDHGAGFVVNDDVQLALAVEADGVHIGARDGDIAATRAQLGTDRVLGVTCGDSLARARNAIAFGASYVAFGRLFPSNTKPDAPPAALETVREAVKTLSVPVCAIGGITPANLPAVTATGAALIAVVDGLFGAEHIELTARAYGRGMAPYN
jgi:thiamine-phosphate pyrophosphorylase